MKHRAAILALVLTVSPILPASAQQGITQQGDGLVTRMSKHAMRATLDRFTAAVRAAGWAVFAELDHAAAARAVALPLRARTVVLFGNPRAGTSAMTETPTLAIDLPMRVLVWEDDQGRIFVTRNTGDDIAERIFARHGIAVPPEGRRATDQVIEGFVRQAAE